MDKIVISLLKIAEEELITAKILYKKGIYHKSLFLFQQSVEKAYKAYAIETRQIELTDLKKVGHDYIKLLKTSITNLPENFRDRIFEEHAELLGESNSMSGNEMVAELMRTGRSDFFSLNEKEIDDYLKDISDYKKLVAKVDFSNLIEYVIINSNKLSTKEVDEFLAGKPNEFTADELKFLKMYQVHGVTLHFLGLMTSPHSEQTRYPQEYNDYKCPTEIYTIEFPLIKYQDRLMKLASNSIKFMKMHCPTQLN